MEHWNKFCLLLLFEHSGNETIRHSVYEKVVARLYPTLLCCGQGLTGRVFQPQVGSGSGIGQNYRVWFGFGFGYWYHILNQSGIIGY